MKNIHLLLRKHRTDIVLILLLLFLTFIVWHRLPEMTIRGDGFVYMLYTTHTTFFKIPLFYTGFENSAMLFGYILPKLFGVNISLYYWLELIIMLVIDVMFYITIKSITKKSSVAFTASLIFAVHYFGNWDMVTTHCYCFFLERIIPTIFLIPSFFFLHRFLETRKKRFFITSSLLYFLGVGLGHFTVFFTPFFLFYPVFWYLFLKSKLKRKLVGGIIGLSYLLQSAFFVAIQQINESGIGPRQWTFTEFLLDPGKYQYVQKFAVQFVYWTQYPVLVKHYAGNILEAIMSVKTAQSLIPYFLIAYLAIACIIYKRIPGQRAMLLTTLIGTTVMFYLNAYFNQYDMLNYTGASRYLFFPTFLLAIFWAYALWSIFWIKKSFVRVIGIFLIAGYYSINFTLVEGAFKQVSILNGPTRAIFDHIIATRDTLSRNTLVIAPYPEFGIQESIFFTERLGRGEVRYMSKHNTNDWDTWEMAASSAAHVKRLSYNRACGCVLEKEIK